MLRVRGSGSVPCSLPLCRRGQGVIHAFATASHAWMAPLQPSLQHEPPPQAAGASYYASCAVASAAAPAAAAAAAAIISRRIPLRIMARGFSGPTVVMFAPPTPPGRRRMRPFSAGVSSSQSVRQQQHAPPHMAASSSGRQSQQPSGIHTHTSGIHPVSHRRQTQFSVFGAGHDARISSAVRGDGSPRDQTLREVSVICVQQ
jgi:hypothetical protein